jgi:hypothetical protein
MSEAIKEGQALGRALKLLDYDTRLAVFGVLAEALTAEDIGDAIFLAKTTPEIEEVVGRLMK